MANGRLLTIDHFLQLASVRSRKLQDELLARIRRESMSVNTLCDELVALGIKPWGARGPARQKKRPASPAVGLHRYAMLADQLTKLAAVLPASVFDEMRQMEPGSMNELLLGCIHQAETATAEARAALRNTAKQLRAAKKYVKRQATSGSSPAPDADETEQTQLHPA